MAAWKRLISGWYFYLILQVNSFSIFEAFSDHVQVGCLKCSAVQLHYFLFFIFQLVFSANFSLKKLAFCIIIQSHELRYPTSVTPSVNSGTMTFFVSGHFFLLTNHVYLSWFCQRTNSVSWRYNYTCLLMTSQGTWSWI